MRREDGGPTATHNLAALCRRCHRQHHLGNLGIVGDADRPDGLDFIDQWGHPIAPAARSRPRTGPPPEPAEPYTHPTGERLDHWALIFPDPPPQAAA